MVAAPEPAEVIPDQTSGSPSPLIAVGSQPAPVLPAPANLPVFGSLQRPLFASTLTSSAPVNPTPDPFPAPVPAPPPAKVLDAAPISVQDLAPAPDAVPDPAPALTQAPAPAAAPAPPEAPPQVETLYIESQSREALDQVLIEDLGPDEEEDVSLSQDKRDDEGNKEEI